MSRSNYLNGQSKKRLPDIAVIIPAFNEADSITRVLGDIPKDLVTEIVVVDNNSSDSTSENARNAGATVISESRRGYGSACLKGIDYLKSKSRKPDLAVFMDADYADYPGEMINLITPIIERKCDLVIGSRTLGNKEAGAMSPPQNFGNWLATVLIRLLYGAKFTDLGPFRAMKFDKLIGLDMRDQTYGWTVEMQVKAVRQKLRFCEVPVSYRVRIGQSKISGTVRGTLRAGYCILVTIFRYWRMGSSQ